MGSLPGLVGVVGDVDILFFSVGAGWDSLRIVLRCFCYVSVSQVQEAAFWGVQGLPWARRGEAWPGNGLLALEFER